MGHWMEWSECSESCGDNGMQTRTRMCSNNGEEVACADFFLDGYSQERECRRGECRKFTSKPCIAFNTCLHKLLIIINCNHVWQTVLYVFSAPLWVDSLGGVLWSLPGTKWLHENGAFVHVWRRKRPRLRLPLFRRPSQPYVRWRRRARSIRAMQHRHSLP